MARRRVWLFLDVPPSVTIQTIVFADYNRDCCDLILNPVIVEALKTLTTHVAMPDDCC